MLTADEETLRRFALEGRDDPGMGESTTQKARKRLGSLNRQLRRGLPPNGDLEHRVDHCLEGEGLGTTETANPKDVAFWTWALRFAFVLRGGRLQLAFPQPEALKLLAPPESPDDAAELNGELDLTFTVEPSQRVVVGISGSSVPRRFWPSMETLPQIAHSLLGALFAPTLTSRVDERPGGMQVELGVISRLPPAAARHVSVRMQAREFTDPMRFRYVCEAALLLCCDLVKEPRDLTTPIVLRQIGSVVKEARAGSEWTSSLSTQEAIRVLEQHRNDLSELVLPAVAALVRHAKGETVRGEKSLTPLEELSEFAEAGTAQIQSSVKRINELLRKLAGTNFQSAHQLQSAVANLQEICRRSGLTLRLRESVGQLKADEKVSITFDRPHSGYVIGRMKGVRESDGVAIRRVSFLPLKIS